MSGTISSEYWPGWVSGLVLSALLVAYFWMTGRFLSSSGRVSILVDRVRGATPAEPDASPEELAEALRLASIETFGARAVQESVTRSAETRDTARAAVRPRASLGWIGHSAFLIGLALGGRAALPFAPFEWTLGEGVWEGKLAAESLPFVLVAAGILIGFGTRMAGGCPIGHGLCGMARGQAGSWAAGIAFFAAGVALSLLVFAT